MQYFNSSNTTFMILNCKVCFSVSKRVKNTFKKGRNALYLNCSRNIRPYVKTSVQRGEPLNVTE